ncbi:MAG: exopolyphosphatase, partial [Alphaproteobacteria bacterium]
MDTNPALAVLDLGTNTFHLLIVTPDDGGGFRELYRERRFVKLALGGIEHIQPDAWQRALAALKHFRQVIDRYGCAEVRAIGTAGLRTADNAAAFLEAIRRETRIEVEVIDGDREAELIFKGTRLAVPMQPGRHYLIMDIGGGSVEFIICDSEEASWAQSFPVGVAVLRRRFHHREPIGEDEIAALRAFLDEQLAPLRHAIAAHGGPLQLVGASGTFDVLAHALPVRPLSAHAWAVPRSHIAARVSRTLAATREERLAMPE